MGYAVMTSNTEKLVISERRGDVVWVTMNRPEVRNALSRAHVRAIWDALEAACDDPEARAIVLAGSDPVFCAGADIREYLAVEDPEVTRQDGAQLNDMLDFMMVCPLPIIARIQKAAFGGAIGLISACDIAIAADDARFSLSEARLGIVPAVISEAVFTALGHRNARQMMLRASPIDAQEAYRIGLVTEVVPAGKLDEAVTAVVDQLRQAAPGAQYDIKKLLYTLALGGLNANQRRDMILDLAARRMLSEEGKEGLASFTEKRSPTWATTPEEA